MSVIQLVFFGQLFVSLKHVLSSDFGPSVTENQDGGGLKHQNCYKKKKTCPKEKRGVCCFVQDILTAKRNITNLLQHLEHVHVIEYEQCLAQKRDALTSSRSN